jgi:1-acyl-sn-glycerol-3-phosphate acyltransferase
MEVKQAKQVNIFAHYLGVLILKVLGWKAVGKRPDAPKIVVVVAPHTSYWDLPMIVFVSWYFKNTGVWFGKAEIFDWPVLGFLFKKVGGLPVYRDRHQGLVDQIVDAFDKHDEILFALTPEGTRKKMPYWKSGFYRVALRAKVPISLGYLDFKKKEVGYGPMFHPTGDPEKDMQVIRDFYATITPRHPDRVGPICFRDEDMKTLGKDS